MQTEENQSSIPSQRISAVLRLSGLHLEVGGTRMNSECVLVWLGDNSHLRLTHRQAHPSKKNQIIYDPLIISLNDEELEALTGSNSASEN